MLDSASKLEIGVIAVCKFSPDMNCLPENYGCATEQESVDKNFNQTGVWLETYHLFLASK